ncbi:MAG: ATP-binding protein [Dehalococcoidia bacterium]
MTIKRQVQVAVIISAGLAAVLGWILFSTFQQVNDATEESRIADEIVQAVFEQNVVASDYLLHRADRAQRQWVARHDSLSTLLSQAEGTFRNPNERAILGTMREDHDSGQSLFSELVTLFEAQENSGQESEVSQELRERLTTRLLLNSQGMVSEVSRLAVISREEIADAQNRAALFVVLFLVIMALLIVTVLFVFNRKVLKPITQLQMGAEIIGKGDLSYRTGVTSRNEVGALSRSFDQMAENLKAITASRDELDREVTQRQRAEDNIRKLNAQLAAANKELEAFSYSVSHDLRTPLRGIDGFSQALMEDYPDRLDDQGKDYLQRVRSGAQRMGVLIDDMLRLSRVTRSEIKREVVDLSALAQSIAAELQETQPERQVEFVIAQGLSASGDAHLLRLLLENLLGNAWKFTGTHPQARIEFGVTQVEGKPAYFVRDDGAGFDIAYADKLFGAFQRLHTEAEFMGSGIGLATVQRIVHRHGGRVWAEGKVEEGATFHFTLPIESP